MTWNELETSARQLDATEDRVRWEQLMSRPEAVAVLAWLLRGADECRQMVLYPNLAGDHGKLAHACGALYHAEQMVEWFRRRWEECDRGHR